MKKFVLAKKNQENDTHQMSSTQNDSHRDIRNDFEDEIHANLINLNRDVTQNQPLDMAKGSNNDVANPNEPALENNQPLKVSKVKRTYIRRKPRLSKVAATKVPENNLLIAGSPDLHPGPSVQNHSQPINPAFPPEFISPSNLPHERWNSFNNRQMQHPYAMPNNMPQNNMQNPYQNPMLHYPTPSYENAVIDNVNVIQRPTNYLLNDARNYARHNYQNYPVHNANQNIHGFNSIENTALLAMKNNPQNLNTQNNLGYNPLDSIAMSKFITNNDMMSQSRNPSVSNNNSNFSNYAAPVGNIIPSNNMPNYPNNVEYNPQDNRMVPILNTNNNMMDRMSRNHSVSNNINNSLNYAPPVDNTVVSSNCMLPNKTLPNCTISNQQSFMVSNLLRDNLVVVPNISTHSGKNTVMNNQNSAISTVYYSKKTHVRVASSYPRDNVAPNQSDLTITPINPQPESTVAEKSVINTVYRDHGENQRKSYEKILIQDTQNLNRIRNPTVKVMSPLQINNSAMRMSVNINNTPRHMHSNEHGAFQNYVHQNNNHSKPQQQNSPFIREGYIQNITNNVQTSVSPHQNFVNPNLQGKNFPNNNLIYLFIDIINPSNLNVLASLLSTYQGSVQNPYPNRMHHHQQNSNDNNDHQQGGKNDSLLRSHLIKYAYPEGHIVPANINQTVNNDTEMLENQPSSRTLPQTEIISQEKVGPHTQGKGENRIQSADSTKIFPDQIQSTNKPREKRLKYTPTREEKLKGLISILGENEPLESVYYKGAYYKLKLEKIDDLKKKTSVQFEDTSKEKSLPTPTEVSQICVDSVQRKQQISVEKNESNPSVLKNVNIETNAPVKSDIPVMHISETENQLNLNDFYRLVESVENVDCSFSIKILPNPGVPSGVVYSNLLSQRKNDITTSKLTNNDNTSALSELPEIVSNKTIFNQQAVTSIPEKTNNENSADIVTKLNKEIELTRMKEIVVQINKNKFIESTKGESTRSRSLKENSITNNEKGVGKLQIFR